MNMFGLRALFVVVCGLTAACGTSVSTMPLNPAPRAMTPRAPMDVHVYTSGRPARNYHEIAVLEAQQESAYSFDQETKVFAKMRAKAARMGCDGLVVLGANDAVKSDPIATVGSPGGSVSTLRGYRGTCIVYE